MDISGYTLCKKLVQFVASPVHECARPRKLGVCRGRPSNSFENDSISYQPLHAVVASLMQSASSANYRACMHVRGSQSLEKLPKDNANSGCVHEIHVM